MVTMTAAVATRAGREFDLREVELDEPRDDEILVRIVAAGVCHTDLNALSGRLPVTMPIILGHEGAGIVERVGARVTSVRPGESVVIVPDYCGECAQCRIGATPYCLNADRLVFGGVRRDGSTKATMDGVPVRAGFFGQSSFAEYSLVTERNVIAVPQDAPLEVLCALTCGTSAGAGAMLNVLRPDPDQTVAVFGAGTVGLTAIAAARMRSAKRILAIDMHASRLELAREFGATDLIDATAEPDLVDAVHARVPGGVDRALDSTGVGDVILAAIYALGTHGVFGFVTGTGGVPLGLDLGRVLPTGVTIRAVMGGEGTGQLFHRELIDLHARGLLPVDRLVRTYPLDRIGDALADMRSGATVKPVILPGAGGRG